MELTLISIAKSDDSVVMRKFGIETNDWEYVFTSTLLDEGQPAVTLTIKTDGIRKGWNIGQGYNMSLLSKKSKR